MLAAQGTEGGYARVRVQHRVGSVSSLCVGWDVGGVMGVSHSSICMGIICGRCVEVCVCRVIYEGRGV